MMPQSSSMIKNGGQKKEARINSQSEKTQNIFVCFNVTIILTIELKFSLFDFIIYFLISRSPEGRIPICKAKSKLKQFNREIKLKYAAKGEYYQTKTI